MHIQHTLTYFSHSTYLAHLPPTPPTAHSTQIHHRQLSHPQLRATIRPEAHHLCLTGTYRCDWWLRQHIARHSPLNRACLDLQLYRWRALCENRVLQRCGAIRNIIDLDRGRINGNGPVLTHGLQEVVLCLREVHLVDGERHCGSVVRAWGEGLSGVVEIESVEEGATVEGNGAVGALDDTDGLAKGDTEGCSAGFDGDKLVVVGGRGKGNGTGAAECDGGGGKVGPRGDADVEGEGGLGGDGVFDGGVERIVCVRGD